MARHKAIDIARWFLLYNEGNVNENGGEQISNMKLQKLLYYAQGCYLASKGEPLFDDPIVAWQHGPVVESIYRKYKVYGSNGIPNDECDKLDLDSFTDDETEILIDVYNVFGQYSAWKLRNMTHQEDPWKETYNGCEISLDLIKDYFKREYIA